MQPTHLPRGNQPIHPSTDLRCHLDAVVANYLLQNSWPGDTELVDSWPGLRALVIVLCHILSFLPPSERSSAPFSQLVTQNPVLKLAWLHVTIPPTKEYETLHSHIRSLLHKPGQPLPTLLNVLQSDLMRTSLLSRKEFLLFHTQSYLLRPGPSQAWQPAATFTPKEIADKSMIVWDGSKPLADMIAKKFVCLASDNGWFYAQFCNFPLFTFVHYTPSSNGSPKFTDIQTFQFSARAVTSTPDNPSSYMLKEVRVSYTLIAVVRLGSDDGSVDYPRLYALNGGNIPCPSNAQKSMGPNKWRVGHPGSQYVLLYASTTMPFGMRHEQIPEYQEFHTLDAEAMQQIDMLGDPAIDYEEVVPRGAVTTIQNTGTPSVPPTQHEKASNPQMEKQPAVIKHTTFPQASSQASSLASSRVTSQAPAAKLDLRLPPKPPAAEERTEALQEPAMSPDTFFLNPSQHPATPPDREGDPGETASVFDQEELDDDFDIHANPFGFPSLEDTGGPGAVGPVNNDVQTSTTQSSQTALGHAPSNPSPAAQSGQNAPAFVPAPTPTASQARAVLGLPATVSPQSPPGETPQGPSVCPTANLVTMTPTHTQQQQNPPALNQSFEFSQSATGGFGFGASQNPTSLPMQTPNSVPQQRHGHPTMQVPPTPTPLAAPRAGVPTHHPPHPLVFRQGPSNPIQQQPGFMPNNPLQPPHPFQVLSLAQQQNAVPSGHVFGPLRVHRRKAVPNFGVQAASPYTITAPTKDGFINWDDVESSSNQNHKGEERQPTPPPLGGDDRTRWKEAEWPKCQDIRPVEGGPPLDVPSIITPLVEVERVAFAPSIFHWSASLRFPGNIAELAYELALPVLASY
ncbi:hypothetical protein JX265_012154 [Neoarthrinium moseri]|uniref:Uncharacterized protein n=1 Tax=Neoarthrinium moseri TaxID=1658444 RepID=A0A9Q0AIQ8_9PEZI|nr:hypothetical protein JX265_012154 [Neoarthrinium moseri]